ncbi:MAG: adenine deaminase [Bacteroidales bacterium]
MDTEHNISGFIVDVVNHRIFKGTIQINNGSIVSIREENVNESQYILPGLIDSHIHVESSMLIPSEFARMAVVHGTVATVSDPHEIANVLGLPGMQFMIDNGKKVPFKFYFGAPSCVPATAFETSGATLGPEEIKELLKRDEIKYLSEMMNFPGVLYNDKEVMAKLKIAKEYNKPVDGHAPGLKGDAARKYCEAGISTDHECFTIEEALDKIAFGMTIQIREGSAAKNFETLIPLIKDFPEKIMLCSDDKHPDDLLEGHINQIVKRAIALGYDPLTVLKVCTYNPVRHYKLDVGLLQEGDPADFIIVNNLKDFRVKSTWINGIMVAKDGKTLIKPVKESTPNIFNAMPIQTNDIRVEANGSDLKVIRAMEGQLITEKFTVQAKSRSNFVENDVVNDILKIVVLNRYAISKPTVGFISGFGLRKGAIASNVAHDSHNIIAVGTTDQEIIEAINLILESKGGISLVNGNDAEHLPLPVAGIMSNEDGGIVAEKYAKLNREAKALGSNLRAPYMTLSFMALLVIPALKLSDKGLFDGTKFEFTSLYEN